MQIGVFAGVGDRWDGSVSDLIVRARDIEERGFASLFLPNIFGLDAIVALALVGRETRRIELATGVVPTFPRHPFAMAQAALTAQDACGGRFTLGIGLSHRVVIEDFLGLSYAHPARHMSEYLEVLAPLLRGEKVSHRGEQFRVSGGLDVPGASRVPVLVGALGPRMLDLAGRWADGTLTWMTGARTLGEYTVPRILRAAQGAGRKGARIAAGFPVVVTNDPDGVREWLRSRLKIYGAMPSYRAMLDREGMSEAGDVAIVGDERQVRAELQRLRDAGVTDLVAAPMEAESGAVELTLEVLAAQIGELGHSHG
jgi:F420-dependent oxidoreductase-like protein